MFVLCTAHIYVHKEVIYRTLISTSYTYRLDYKLDNETVLQKEFNLTFDDVWEFRPKLKPFHWKGFFYVICATMHVPQIRMTSTGSAVII